MTNETDFHRTSDEGHRLGVDSRSYGFSHGEEALELCYALISQARQRILILSPDLESGLYDHPQLFDAFSGFARRSPRCELRMLIRDERPLIGRSHGLITLLHRLPSRVQLRLMHPDQRSRKDAWLLADHSGLLYRKDIALSRGFVNLHNPGRVRQLAEEFEAQWKWGQESQELRILGL